MNPLIIILRVLGGISTLYLLGNKTYNYNVYLLYFAFFSVLLFIYNLFISLIRIRYIYKRLNSDKLNIKNSALDQLAILSVSIILWGKAIPPRVDVDKGIMLGVDIALKKAEHKAILGTISGSVFKTIQPKDKQVEKIILDLVRKPLSDIDSNNRNVKELTEITFAN